MTGFDYICEAISLFEASLASEEEGKIIRTVSELSRRTGYSVYHFTRLFSAITDQPPKEYVSGRILSEAAKKIAATTRPLGAVALESGFADYAVFSRAFKKRFGISPRRVRESRSLPFDTVERLTPRKAARTIDPASREPALIGLEARSVTGLPFYIEEGTKTFHAQWATFCQFSSWTDQETLRGLSVLCAQETEEGTPQQPIFTTRRLGSATYLRFRHGRDVSTLYETYRYIYRDWLATHETRPLDFWELQRYPDGDTIEICIPGRTVSPPRSSTSPPNAPYQRTRRIVP